MQKMTEQEMFDVLSFFTQDNKCGIEVEQYLYGNIRLTGGFFTTSQLDKIREIFPRMNYDSGLVFGYWD